MTESHAEANPFLAFTDADLKALLRRAMRLVAALTVMLAGYFQFDGGWRTALQALTGGAVSLAGLYEWGQLIEFVNARLDSQRPPRSTARVVSMFLLRLILAGAAIYGSLKCSRGEPYALIAGLGLAVLALTVEALRMLRS